MDDKKKLSEQELAAIRERPTTPGYWAECQEADNAIFRLLDHIDVIEAEHAALITRAMADADRVGNAYIEFTNQQSAKIGALESIMVRVAALGVMAVGESLGIAAGRMAYMRDSLQAALKGDLTLLEAAEQMFNEPGEANGRR